MAARRALRVTDPTADRAAPWDARTAFRERLREGPLLCDGAMGTELYNAGYGFERSFDALCLEAPSAVTAVHRAYVAAGAGLIETNSFGANALRLAEHGLSDQVEAINHAAARLARGVADEAGGVWVAGSMGPLGATLAPVGQLAEPEARAAFAEQARALAGGGVDVLFIETMRDLREAEIALSAAREVCALPIVVCATFDEDGLAAGGATPEHVAAVLSEAGADAVGANCSTGPAPMQGVLARMATTATVPLIAMPNAGLPMLAGGRYLYAAPPLYFAEAMAAMAADGVALVGGCCGTTPEHIRALAAALEESRAPSGAARAHVAAVPTAPAAVDPPTALRRALAAARPAVMMRVEPPRGFNVAPLLADLAALARAAGVDALLVADAPRAQARMSALALSALLRTELGVAAVLEVGCHYRNLVATHSELLGAHALGVRDLMVVEGELPATGDYPSATVVRDLTAPGLIGLVARFNAGFDASGQPTPPTAFHVGAAVDLAAHDFDRARRDLDAQLDAGAEYAVSRLLFDPSVVERWLVAYSGAFPVPLLASVVPLLGARHARYLHNEVPGIDLPAALLERMAAAGDAAPDAGVAAACELIAQLGTAIAGVCLQPPSGRFAQAAAVAAILCGEQRSQTERVAEAV